MVGCELADLAQALHVPCNYIHGMCTCYKRLTLLLIGNDNYSEG